ncbi:phosphoribosyl-AMP cyclohydrolase [Salinadaptatus halalkaliphilus]|uniref:Phosphoribosyl-AMP cyclohydrolase n=1 Tax=Salinadaptatus halalkaliphilus TaxID=2419781 RepID=A0A4S3TL00_9EURY|nr:phosphoribosyl-AMP cyclohydrolase [Salinadaptatus halalkaliphilus]THE63268.1 phosphoribosyl-AMP cyclohydrolase [Salinadaptatus halalkaliphilus]
MEDDVTVDFGADGLVPAVAQDAETGEVLMLAYVSAEALERTHETGRAHYYSRSRDELWEKGKTSGHVQRVEEIRVDCDADTLLYVVEQDGGACHTGHRSCFYRAIDGVSVGDTNGDSSGTMVDVENVGEQVFDPDAVYEA